ncbi:uncharacterized protein LOC126894572 [Daktulosphaira vitifoliae]|uniref:uncharacterized protein LOC126894572 n=1 Tax=Daktulosphaira vitifoliae TaxID=58002 RepID=UPI0021A9FFE2|nr:uncharacterized protein LOC126894572 [Daktulosphaira vitifoliae]XP_050521655.1 uncharacterized protein LOC126894572 [Daktulosphaira vitifoliae]XP_050521656.1 uncharacterized protein LOC126894572 [Daktulosphaira vitifoliae]
MKYILLLTFLILLSLSIISLVKADKKKDSEVQSRKRIPSAKSSLKNCLKSYKLADMVTGYFGGYLYDFNHVLNEYRVRLLDKSLSHDEVTNQMGSYICDKYTAKQLDLHGGIDGCKYKVKICSQKFQHYLIRKRLSKITKLLQFLRITPKEVEATDKETKE